MSQPASLSKRKADADAAEAAQPKRQAPRPSHAGPNPVAAVGDGQDLKDEHPAEPAASAASSPVRRVDISLRCVFGWLDLGDLHRVLSVSKQWHANVCTMPSIDASAAIDELRPLSTVCASSLARHVSSLGPRYLYQENTIVSASDLATVAARMPALLQLGVTLAMSSVSIEAGPLPFPQRLTGLSISLDWADSPAAAPAPSPAVRVPIIQTLLQRIGTLTMLDSLTLHLSHKVRGARAKAAVSFQPLRALHRLRRFTFSWNDNRSQRTLSEAQLDCLRYLSNSHALRSLSLFGGDIDRLLTDMLARNETEPLLVHELDVDSTSVAAVHAPALRCFPELRSLKPWCFLVVDFLPCMPHLHTLHVSPPQSAAVTADQLVQAITPLVQLTDLHVHNHPTLNEEQLTRLLAPLTLLRELELFNLPQLRSLAFLASGPITLSLRSFHLLHCHHSDLRTSSLLHVHPCIRLTTLYLSHSLSDPLCEFGRALCEQRPCSTLPELETFNYFAFDPSVDEDEDQEDEEDEEDE